MAVHERGSWPHAGVIGLATALSLLQNTQNQQLSVVLVEANRSIPVTAVGSGAATGAGAKHVAGRSSII